MRRSLFTALLILLAAGVMAMGATPLDDAKKSVATADKEVVANAATLQAIGKSLAQHLAVLADVARQLDAIRDRQQRAAPIIAKALDAVNANVAIAQAEAAAAQRALRDAEAALAAAQGEVAPKRAAIERAASTERKDFESSDPFKDASAKVTAADAAIAKERARLDESMKGSASLALLLTAASKAEADLAAARTRSPADDAAVAEASARWIEAKNALIAAQSEVYAADANFVAAQKSAAAAAAARMALSDAFDRSILTQPGVAEAQLAFRDAQNAVKVAEADVDAAREAVGRAGRWLISQRSNADVIGRIAQDADDALIAAQADLKRAQLAVRGIAQDLTAAAASVLGVRDDLKTATDAINAASKK
jgi:hypothetical protein